MKYNLLVLVAVGAILAISAFSAGARGLDAENKFSFVPLPDGPGGVGVGDTRGAFRGTLWIFDADFNDLGNPHNQNWMSYDLSGTIGQENYWHKDTIRPKFAGDSTWWCGKYDVCWRQARGYGNNWIQFLHRDFPLATWGGTAATFEFDQRFAMEHDYDYGYVEVSTDGGATWEIQASYTNTGFFQKPGAPKDWGDPTFGHPQLNMDAYAGQDLRLRYRFTSDVLYSSQDQYDNTQHSVRDGAWQVDNFKWTVDGDEKFYDDSQSPGDNGWVHEDLVASGQDGHIFYRGLYGDEFTTGAAFTCEDREGWMYGASDIESKVMVDGMSTALVSPPINIEGAQNLVGEWDMWVDLPYASNDIFNLQLASHDLEQCVQDIGGFSDEAPGAWYGGPFWGTWTDDWDAFAGNKWLAVRWDLWNDDPAQPGTHMAGILLNRQRVGIPEPDPTTQFNYSTWYRFNDWFREQMADALEDSAIIEVKDQQGVADVDLLASNDGGVTWYRYDMVRPQEESNDWYAPPPEPLMEPGKEILYYFEATDDAGSPPSTYPDHAIQNELFFEFSILPISATTTSPGILLVDKHGRRIPGEIRDYGGYDPTGLSFCYSQLYYEEALRVLGYEYEIYDVEVPSGSTDQSNGPDTMGYKYYDTQIWWTWDFNSYTIKYPFDTDRLIAWLGDSTKWRSLLVSGNDVGKDMVATMFDSADFYQGWMKSEYIQNAIGDTMPFLEDVAGGRDFFPGRECLLFGGCPDPIEEFDVLNPRAGAEGVVQYREHPARATFNAGVAFEDATLKYRTVNLGFGMEAMMDALLPNGYFVSGVADRAALLDSIMTFFQKDATGPPTDVPLEEVRNTLSHAYPNPFNPVTKIAYSVRETGPATIKVYSAAGKVVRTLLETELEAGASGFVVWDGRDDIGEQCASGIYFYRIEAPGFATTKKMVMLK